MLPGGAVLLSSTPRPHAAPWSWRRAGDLERRDHLGGLPRAQSGSGGDGVTVRGKNSGQPCIDSAIFAWRFASIAASSDFVARSARLAFSSATCSLASATALPLRHPDAGQALHESAGVDVIAGWVAVTGGAILKQRARRRRSRGQSSGPRSLGGGAPGAGSAGAADGHAASSARAIPRGPYPMKRRMPKVNVAVATTVPTIHRMSRVSRFATSVRTPAIPVRCSVRRSAICVESRVSRPETSARTSAICAESRVSRPENSGPHLGDLRREPRVQAGNLGDLGAHLGEAGPELVERNVLALIDGLTNGARNDFGLSAGDPPAASCWATASVSNTRTQRSTGRPGTRRRDAPRRAKSRWPTTVSSPRDATPPLNGRAPCARPRAERQPASFERHPFLGPFAAGTASPGRAVAYRSGVRPRCQPPCQPAWIPTRSPPTRGAPPTPLQPIATGLSCACA